MILVVLNLRLSPFRLQETPKFIKILNFSFSDLWKFFQYFLTGKLLLITVFGGDCEFVRYVNLCGNTTCRIQGTTERQIHSHPSASSFVYFYLISPQNIKSFVKNSKGN